MPPTLLLPLQVCVAVAAICWLLSVFTREYSWVDRIWSMTPPVYVGIFAWQSGWEPRLVLMTALTTAWGARLTFNFARKGGYAPGGEDYRWDVLRQRMHPALWQVFNVVFISGYQNALLLLISLPAWAAAAHPGAPLGVVDAVATVGFVGSLIGETVADQHQWDFYARRARGEPVPERFNTGGLFAWSRHPNFFFEQAQWWFLYLYSVGAGADPLNPTLAGAVLLTLLFDGSTRFTEQITRAKYPTYADYQRRVSRWLPLPPGRGRAGG